MTKTVDWAALVADAMGSADVPPRPEQLQAHLREWGRQFEHEEKGPPVEADFPDPVREFFAALATAGKTCPFKNRQVAFVARQAWEHAVYRDAFGDNLLMAQFAKKVGVEYNGAIIEGESPTEAVQAGMAAQTQFGVERLRKVLKRK